MTVCRNNLLCNDNLVTYGAVRAFGLTCLGTVGSYRLVNNLGVTLSGNLGLCLKNLVTYGTVLTFGKTGLGTCRSLCRINNLGVTVCGNNLLSLFVETVLTVLTLFKTGCGTCRSLCRVNYESMTKSINALCLCSGTNCTCICFNACVCTIGLSCYLTIIINVVSGCLNLVAVIPLHRITDAVCPTGRDIRSLITASTAVILYAADDKATDLCGNLSRIYIVLAILANKSHFCSGPSVVFATVPVVNLYISPKPIILKVNCYSISQVNCLTNAALALCEAVTESIHSLLCNGCTVTSGAVRAFSLTGSGTSRSNRLVNYDVMTESIYGLLCNGCTVTSGAVRAFSLTGSGTSRSNRLVNYDIVTESIDNSLALDVITTRTILVCAVAGIQTIRSLTLNVNKSVTEGGLDFCRTYSTLLCSCTCRSCTGSMTGCRDYRSAYQFTTICTSNSGRAVYCTSCVLCCCFFVFVLALSSNLISNCNVRHVNSTILISSGCCNNNFTYTLINSNGVLRIGKCRCSTSNY